MSSIEDILRNFSDCVLGRVRVDRLSFENSSRKLL